MYTVDLYATVGIFDAQPQTCAQSKVLYLTLLSLSIPELIIGKIQCMQNFMCVFQLMILRNDVWPNNTAAEDVTSVILKCGVT